MNDLDRLFSGMRIASSGMSAERRRIDVIAENIANARTTRTPEGGPYRRKLVAFEPLLAEVAGGELPLGVRASEAPDLVTPFEVVHDPSHPDADATGHVRLPNVNAVLEMADLVTALRSYEASLSAQESFVRMAERALEIARR